MAMVAPPWLPWRRHGSSSQRSGRGLEAAGTQTHAPRAPGHHVQPLTWTLLSSPAVVCTAGSCCSVGWSVDAMRSVSLGGSGLDRRRQQISRGVIGQEVFLRIKRKKDKLYQNETKTHCAGRRACRRSSSHLDVGEDFEESFHETLQQSQIVQLDQRLASLASSSSFQEAGIASIEPLKQCFIFPGTRLLRGSLHSRRGTAGRNNSAGSRQRPTAVLRLARVVELHAFCAAVRAPSWESFWESFLGLLWESFRESFWESF